MEPPPAPTVTISIIGILAGYPSTSLSLERRLPVFNQADINAGAAHIEGDNLVNAALLSNINSADNARAGAGYGCLNRTVNCLVDGYDGAVGLCVT